MPSIVTLPGDGIGPEVLASALEVLAAVADDLSFEGTRSAAPRSTPTASR